MFWIIAAPSLLALAALVGLMPYRALGRAAANVRRSDGTLSSYRARSEARRFGRFIRSVAVKPMGLLLLVQILLVAHHYSLGPAHWLANTFGEFHPEVALSAPDLDAWRQAYNESSQAGASRGGDAHGVSRLVDRLVDHWPLYPAYLALSFAFVFHFFVYRFGHFANRYIRGTRMNQLAYGLDDVKNLPERRANP
jgi:hypothetical protein